MTRRVPTQVQPLRIAMVAACPFPSPRGSQVLIRGLAQALADRGHEVHLVTYPYGESLVPIHGIFVHRLRAPRLAGASRGSQVGWRKLLLDAYLVSTLYRVVRRERIQIIHAHNYEGQIIAYLVRKLTGVPVVYHSHNALSDELGYYFRPGWARSAAHLLGRVLDRHIPCRADFSIALTAELETFLRARGVARGQSAVIPPGITAGSPPECGVSHPDPFAGRFVVMYAGNLDAYQDLDVLFNGFEAVREEIGQGLLVVVTHDAQWSAHSDGRLEGLVRHGHARVIVTPAFSVVRRFLARADVLVCPRSSWSGFPIKLLNYMATGRPLVAAEGSAKGIIDGDTGLVFRNGDAAGLGAALRRLYADGALRSRLGAHARAAAHALYSWKRIASQVEQVYAAVRQQTAPAQPWGAVPARKARGLIGFPKRRMSAAAKGRPD